MDNQIVNGELENNETQLTENQASLIPVMEEKVQEDTSLLPETPLTESSEQLAVSSEQPSNPEIAETVAETPATLDAVADVSETLQQETSEVAETVAETPAAPDVLADIKETFQQGTTEQLIAAASPQELILLFEQLNEGFDKLSLRQAIDFSRLIKDRFDMFTKEEKVSAEQSERFSSLYGRFNKRRGDAQKKNEESNTLRKRELIEQLKSMLESGILDQKRMKAIQDEWKELRFVTKDAKEDLDKKYKALIDTYFKKRGQEAELLEYDRKRNLEVKNEIITKIRNMLPSEEDAGNGEVWRERAAILTDLQRQFRDTGFVPREDMDRINAEYKDVVENFYAHRREFFESQETGMQENVGLKEAILEKMLPYSTAAYERPKQWEDATTTFLALQEEWKKIGKAPADRNGDLWKRFREISNVFYTNKSEYFNNLEQTRSQNLELKRGLCEKAEALKDNIEGENAANEIKQLQEDWKNVGPVPDRQANKLWDRFRSACDSFFENRRERFKGVKDEETKNLQAKKDLIAKVAEFIAALAENRDAAVEGVKELQNLWKGIGRVPIKFKEPIWIEFKETVDGFFNTLREMGKANNADRGDDRGGDRRNAGGGGDNRPPRRDRPNNYNNNNNSHYGGNHDNQGNGNDTQSKIFRIRKRISSIEESLATYENNILYISKGKSGDALRAQFQAKIDEEQQLLATLNKEIKDIQKAERDAKKAAEKPVEKPQEVAETPESDAPIAEDNHEVA